MYHLAMISLIASGLLLCSAIFGEETDVSIDYGITGVLVELETRAAQAIESEPLRFRTNWSQELVRLSANTWMDDVGVGFMDVDIPVSISIGTVANSQYAMSQGVEVYLRRISLETFRTVLIELFGSQISSEGAAVFMLSIDEMGVYARKVSEDSYEVALTNGVFLAQFEVAIRDKINIDHFLFGISKDLALRGDKKLTADP